MKSVESRPCPCEGGTLVRFLQPIILAALSREACHGYILLHRIAQTQLWQDSHPDPAGVYRALRDMEARGLISSKQWAEGKGTAGRRIFCLTEEGLRCKEKWHQTLCTYRDGVEEVIALLEQEPLPAAPSPTAAPHAEPSRPTDNEGWYPIIDTARCIRCGKCVELCVKNRHFAYDPAQAPVPVLIHPENCVDHCHGCGNLCPRGAISYHGDSTGWRPPNQQK